MPKRPCPFSPRGNQLKMLVDERIQGREEYEKKIHAKTLTLLKEGSIKAWNKNYNNTNHNSNSEIQSSIDACSSCRTKNYIGHCSFCERCLCQICTRVCTVCHGGFCHQCCIENYDEPQERAFCLSCQ